MSGFVEILRGALLWSCTHDGKFLFYFNHAMTYTVCNQYHLTVPVGHVCNTFSVSHPWNALKKYSHTGITITRIHVNFQAFSTLYSFTWVFKRKKPLKHWPNVTQHAFRVRIRRNLARAPTLVMHTCWQIFGSFQSCNHVHHLQSVPSYCVGRAGVQHVLRFTSMKRTQKKFTCWHHHHKHPCQFSTIFYIVCIY